MFSLLEGIYLLLYFIFIYLQCLSSDSVILSLSLSLPTPLSLYLPLFLPSRISPSFQKEYEPTIYYPKRTPNTIHQDFTVQCEKMDIPFLSYLPTEVSNIKKDYKTFIDTFILELSLTFANITDLCKCTMS